MAKTILCMGAHYDDCVFGVAGIMLHAVRKNHRVVNLSLIGDYSNWSPVRGREKQLLEGCHRLGEEYGVETRFLDFASHRFDTTLPFQKEVAQAVADIKPDVAFILWRQDRHHDHEVASELCQVALRHGDRLLENVSGFRRAREIYSYDNGPGHTIGFEPNKFYDTTDVWSDASDWLGKLMSVVRNTPYDRAKRHAAQRNKETLARYRGATCGRSYAEAVWAHRAQAEDFL